MAAIAAGPLFAIGLMEGLGAGEAVLFAVVGASLAIAVGAVGVQRDQEHWRRSDTRDEDSTGRVSSRWTRTTPAVRVRRSDLPTSSGATARSAKTKLG